MTFIWFYCIDFIKDNNGNRFRNQGVAPIFAGNFGPAAAAVGEGAAARPQAWTLEWYKTL